jgi:hypothetical protein
MNQTYASVVQLTKMLKNLDGWLDKAVEHAKSKNFDPERLVQARLSPDMYSLSRQVESACDGVKFTAARLAGKDAPKHEDGEHGLDTLRARISSVIDFVSSFKESDFEGAESRVVPLSYMPGKGVVGADYLNELNVPNTYFHFSMAYAILRHNGVPLGKMDYLGSINLRDV